MVIAVRCSHVVEHRFTCNLTQRKFAHSLTLTKINVLMKTQKYVHFSFEGEKIIRATLCWKFLEKYTK